MGGTSSENFQQGSRDLAACQDLSDAADGHSPCARPHLRY
jgi:hypothetical protein